MIQRLKKEAAIALSILLIVAVIIEGILAFNLFKLIEPVDNKTDNILLKYEEESFNDYKVILVDNEFIPEEYQNMGESYILDFVNFITFTNRYTYTATETADINGKFYVEARLYAYHKVSSDKNENPKIWDKPYEIKEQAISHYNVNTFTEQIAFNLELEEFQNDFDAFKETLTDVMMEGYLEINFKVEFEGYKDGFKFDENYTDRYTIPLSNTVFSIDHTPDVNSDNTIYRSEIEENNPMLIAALIVAIIIIFIGILVIIKILFFRSDKTNYRKAIDEILKDYDEIIVTSSNSVDEDKFEQVLEIEEFKELFELSRELATPIMHYESPNGNVTYFFIIKDDLLYINRQYEQVKYRRR